MSRMSFRAAVARLQRNAPGSVPVGHQGPPTREAVRFKPVLGMEFPSTDVANVRESSTSGYVEVETNFLGLYGTPSPLPASYTEDLIDEGEEGLTRGFLDLFNHRLISLFYRAMEKYRFSWQFAWSGDDPVSRRLQLLCGLPSDSWSGGIPSLRLLAFAGAIRRGAVSAATLRSVLTECFADVAIELEQCVPQWLEIPAGDRSSLGQQGCELGRAAFLGTRVLDRANTFRVVLGPLTGEQFMAFLPGAPRLRDLRRVLDFFNRGQLSYEVELRLDPEAIPDARLGSEATALGWSSWLGEASTSASDAGTRIRFLFKEWHHE